MSAPPPPVIDRVGHRFLRGSVALSAGIWFSSFINFGLNIGLARLLGPSAFGLYAFVFAVNEFISIVAAFGIPLAVLQAREESDELYDTAYALSAGLGVIALLCALVAAPIVATYRSLDAAWFIIAFAVFRILSMQSQIHTVRVERQLRYGALAIIAVAVSNVPGIVAIGCAWVGAGVWSLMVRDGLAAFINFLSTLLVSRYRFRGRVRRKMLAKLMSFSTPLFVARTIEIALVRIDRIVVGSFFGDRILGLYHQALTLSETGLVVLAPIHRLSFNLFARLQDDPERLARSYEILNFLTLRLVFAGGLVLVIFPEATIQLLLGEEWVEASPILRWLGVYAAILPIEANMKQLLIARGNVRAHVAIRFVQLCLVVPGILLAAYAGSIQGVAAVIAGIWILGTVLSGFANQDVGGYGILRVFLMPVIGGLGTVGIFHAAARSGLLESTPSWLLPFLPPVVFALLLLASEGKQLLGKFRYLQSQLRASGDERGDELRAE